MCACVCVPLQRASIHTRGHVSRGSACPSGSVGPVPGHERCPAGPPASVPVCAPVLVHATPPPPPVSGADDIGAEESDDKCPLSANEADDKWAGARAAPLRCNNRRWMAWRPPPTPTPCAGNGSPSGSTLPGGSHTACPAANHGGPGRDAQAGSREPKQPPAAEEQSSELSRSRGRTGQPSCPRRGHAAVHTHGLHTRQPPVSLHGAPAAPVQAQPPPHRTTDTCLCARHGHTSPPDLGTHPPAEIQAHRAMHTPTPAICARAYRNHLCLGTCMLPTCLHMPG